MTPGKPGLCVHAGIVELCSPHTMVVNKYGKRFADETFFQGIVPQLRYLDPMKHEYPNLPAFLIFDSQYLKRFSFANQPVGSEVPKTVPRATTLCRACAQARRRCRGTGEDRRAFQRLCAHRRRPRFPPRREPVEARIRQSATRQQCQPRHHRGAAVLWRRAASDRLGLGRPARRQQWAGHPPAPAADPRALRVRQCRGRPPSTASAIRPGSRSRHP